MNLTVTTATSLQIAIKEKDAATYTTYKNVVSNNDITGTIDATNHTGGAGYTNMFATGNEYLMAPATIGNATLKASDSFLKSNGHMAGTLLDQFVSATVGEGNVKKLPLRFISSSNTHVYIGFEALINQTVADLITAKTTAGTPTQDELDAQAVAIKSALRIAVVPRNTSDYASSSSDPVIFQFDAGAEKWTGSGNNTDYKTASVEGMIDEAAGKYAAVKTVNETTKTVTAVEAQTAQLPATKNYLASVMTDTDNGTTVITVPAATKASLFELAADKPRDVDIYIWLEGTDQDCISAMSGYTFNVTLPFAAGGAPTTTP